jgi:diaminopimelate decarboxylase
MELSWERLRQLEQEYGDSFYILDTRAFEENYTEFLGAFRVIYPNTNIAYSYKTNYTPSLCRSVNAMGGYAEVVSRLEYDLAVHIGVPPRRIIFNGPYKRGTDLEVALRAGSLVNLDSLYEVALLEEVASKSPGQLLTVGIRCNFDIGADVVSRFGFDADGDAIQEAFARLRRLENCRVAGLHSHFTTTDRSVESYALRIRRMLELAACHFKGGYPAFIDLGGGFFGKMSPDLRKQFPCHVPTYHEYAAAIATPLAQTFSGATGPELILEPGIALTGNVMQFVAKVVDVKRIRSRTMALVSGSIHNIKPNPHERNLPVHVFSRNSKPAISGDGDGIDLVGYTCLEDDCLYRGYQGTLASDDYVVFDNVGAYITVMKPPFIRPSPPIVAYDSALETLQLVRRWEEFSDLFATYVFQ